MKVTLIGKYKESRIDVVIDIFFVFNYQLSGSDVQVKLRSVYPGVLSKVVLQVRQVMFCTFFQIIRNDLPVS